MYCQEIELGHHAAYTHISWVDSVVVCLSIAWLMFERQVNKAMLHNMHLLESVRRILEV